MAPTLPRRRKIVSRRGGALSFLAIATIAAAYTALPPLTGIAGRLSSACATWITARRRTRGAVGARLRPRLQAQLRCAPRLAPRLGRRPARARCNHAPSGGERRRTGGGSSLVPGMPCTAHSAYTLDSCIRGHHHLAKYRRRRGARAGPRARNPRWPARCAEDADSSWIGAGRNRRRMGDRTTIRLETTVLSYRREWWEEPLSRSLDGAVRWDLRGAVDADRQELEAARRSGLLRV